MTAIDFVSRLGADGRPKQTSTGWQARCPAHEDGTASLTITQEGDKVLLYCHALCTTEAVVAAVGLKMADLFTPKTATSGHARKSEIVATYDYTDESVALLYQAVRFEPKDFRQRRPDASRPGGWIWSIAGVRPVPYRLPELIDAVAAGHPVFIVEGEKDADALHRAGLTATCNSGGAGNWKPEFAEQFKGATACVIADKDPAGRKHAQQVAANLQPVASHVVVIELPDIGEAKVKDAADYLGAGGIAAGIVAMVNEAPSWTPQAPPVEPVTTATNTAADSNRAGITSEYLGTEPEEESHQLPDIVDASDFVATPQEEPRELIHGLLHQGSKLVLGGGSKSFKTWTLLDLALSVSHGLPWLGRETTAGPVLYINFEIQDFAWQKRIAAVAQAKGIELKPGAIKLWNLRGHAADFKTLLPKVIRATKEMHFALIVLDPIYKLYGNSDENKAGDVAALMNGLEAVSVQTKAATAFGAHFSKGNQAGKEAIDRISGSGVFARDPDTILIFTKHEEQDAFTVEPILRNFKPVDPFAVRWQFPLFQRDDGLDPSKLKQIPGRKASHFPDDILKLLPPEGLTDGDWLSAAKKKNIGKTTYYRLKKDLEAADKVLDSKVTGRWTPLLVKPSV